MYVRGIGHGGSTAIDYRDGIANIWVGTDDTVDPTRNTPSGIGYFQWAPSDTHALDNADIPNRYFPLGHPIDWSYCGIDPINRRLCYSWFDENDLPHYALYPLDEAYQDIWNPIATFTAPLTSTWQGMATCGNYMYLWTGKTLAKDPDANTVMHRYDWRTGQEVEAVKVDDLLGQVERREPEGLSVWLPDPSDPGNWRLGAGFSCTKNGRYVQSVISWPAGFSEPAVEVDWTDLPLVSGTVPYASNTAVQYRVLAGGIAQLRGMIKQSDGSTYGPADAASASYYRFCTDMPDELLWDGTQSRWRREPVGGEYSRPYVLEIAADGIMNVAWAEGSGGAHWIDLTATWAIDPTTPN
jgi:hypothetical protein